LIRAVRGGAIGVPFLIKGSHESAIYDSDELPEQLDLHVNGGGYTMTAGIHTINLTRQLVGPCKSVMAYGVEEPKSEEPYLDRTTVASFTTGDGVVGIFDFTGRSKHFGERRMTVEVFGSEGSIQGDLLSGRVTQSKARRSSRSDCGYPRLRTDAVQEVRESAYPSLGFTEEVQDFRVAVHRGEPRITDLMAHCDALATVLAIYRSLGEHGPVEPGQLLAEAGLTGEHEEIGTYER
jgi:predicted dehydrogenase